MRKASGLLLAACTFLLMCAPVWAADDAPSDEAAAAAGTGAATDQVKIDLEAADVATAEAAPQAPAAACGCAQCAAGTPCSSCDECATCDCEVRAAPSAGCAEQCGECETCKSGGEFFGPLAILNLHPPTAIFLSPTPDVATVLPEGKSYLRVGLTHANHLIRELDSGVIADYDFENIRAGLDYHVGTGGGEFGAQLAFTHRGHGFLDTIIEDWHGWFGLPNGNRNKFPDYQYHYTIATREGLVFNDQGDSYGLGDLALSYKLPVYDRGGGRRALALRAGAKLPTGDPDKALGSGNLDFQLGALYQHQFGNRLRGYLNVDWIFVGEPDWQNVGHQDAIATLWALEYRLDGSTTAVAQYRTHRNPLQVGSFEADKDGQELALGLNKRLNDGLVWSWGFDEDLNPETAPDFVLYTDLKFEF